MAAAIETAVTQGRLNMKQIRELKEADVDLDSMVSTDFLDLFFEFSFITFSMARYNFKFISPITNFFIFSILKL